LDDNQITDAGAATLAQALPGSQVKDLSLHGNQITDMGAAALAEALSGSQATGLGLGHNQMRAGMTGGQEDRACRLAGCFQ
jgi:hypothetical protein